MFVRHHLELSVQAWSPWYAKDVELLEGVQRRMVNQVVGLKSPTYEGKLSELGLTTLEERRSRGDMIQVWKYLHGQNPGGDQLFSRVNEQAARASRHTSKVWNIDRIDWKLETRKNSFTVRSVNRWNNLPHHVQSAEDLNTFKNRYDKFMCCDGHSSSLK